jgi:hypothetical protein
LESALEEYLRRIFTISGTITAIFSPLITAYSFLSEHGFIWKHEEHVGILTILINVCTLAGALSIFGAIVGGLPLGFVIASKSGILRILGPVNLFIWGSASIFLWVPLSSETVLIRLYCLVVLILGFLSLSSRGRIYAELNFVRLFVLLWLFGIILLLVYMREPNLSMRSLSGRSWFFWFIAAVGCAVYVSCFVAFQQWYTKGKWREKVLKGE